MNNIMMTAVLYDGIDKFAKRYSCSVWGYKHFSCIDTVVQNKAIRFFLGLTFRSNTAIYIHIERSDTIYYTSIAAS